MASTPMEHVNLGRSPVLAITTRPGRVCFLLDAALEPDHANFRPPARGDDPFAHTRIRWCLDGAVHWSVGPRVEHPTLDPVSGEMHHGTIGAWWTQGDLTFLEGEWGSVRVRHAEQTVVEVAD